MDHPEEVIDFPPPVSAPRAVVEPMPLERDRRPDARVIANVTVAFCLLAIVAMFVPYAIAGMP